MIKSKILFYLKQLNEILRALALLFVFFDLDKKESLQECYEFILEEIQDVKQLILDLQKEKNDL